MPLFNCSECHSPNSIEIFVIYDTDVAVFLEINPQEMRKSEDLDQPAHMRRLIRVFAVRNNHLLILSKQYSENLKIFATILTHHTCLKPFSLLNS